MASRQWLSTAVRQCKTMLSQLHSQHTPPSSRLLSTTVPAAMFRKVSAGRDANPSSQLAALDDLGESVKGWVSATNGSAVSSSSRRADRMRTAQEDLAANTQTDSYVRQMPRRWRKGDVYAPRDLSPVEMRRWKKMTAPELDAVDALGFNPLDNYRNFALISEYVTSAGRIQHSSQTGLRPVNQRKMAKAIRRAIGLGIHPSVHLHPQILLSKSRFHNHGSLPSTANPPSARNTQMRW